MPDFRISDKEIQDILQLSILQGGSKHRQADIYKALDRVIARGPIEMPEKSEKMCVPAWLDQALNEGDGVYRP